MKFSLISKSPTEGEGLGAYLSRERLDREISLDVIASETRIRKFYLECIEQGIYDRIPTGPVGRGFVRAFATYIGVDADAAAALYNRESGYKSIETEPEPVAFSAKLQRGRAEWSMVPVISVVAFILVSGAALWFARGRTDRLIEVTNIDRLAKRVKTVPASVLQRLPSLKNVISNGEKSPAPAELPPEAAAAAPSPPAKAVNRSALPAANGTPPPAQSPPLAEGTSRVEKGIITVNTNVSEKTSLPKVMISRPGAEGAGSRNGGRGEPENSPADDRPAPNAPPEIAVAKAAPPEGGDSANSDAAPEIREPLIGVSNGEGPLTLKISAVEDTWLRVVVDGGERFEFLLETGKDIVWKGNREFMLAVGNVFGTRVFLNGASVPLPSPSTNVLHEFVVTEKYLN